MKSISIHKIEDKLMALIEKRSRETGLSLNKTIKLLLAEAVGLHPEERGKNRFEEFCGVWDDPDVKEFEKATHDFSQIDPTDWK